MAGNKGRIGVFDSGVGGLTVAAALSRKLPAWPIVYLGDTARLPYGTKSAATVRRYTERNVAFLVKQGVSIVVVACNSASALALETQGPLHLPVREAEGEAGKLGVVGTASAQFAQGVVPVLGVVVPGAEAAARVAKRRVGIVATEATVRSDAYPRALRALRPELEIYSAACPLLVPLVEEGWLEDSVTREVVGRYLEPLVHAKIDTLILGCTHYPLLEPVFRAVVGPDVRLLDSADAVSDQVAVLLDGAVPHSNGEQGCALQAFVTDDSPRFARIAEAVLGAPVRLEWVDTPS